MLLDHLAEAIRLGARASINVASQGQRFLACPSWLLLGAGKHSSPWGLGVSDHDVLTAHALLVRRSGPLEDVEAVPGLHDLRALAGTQRRERIQDLGPVAKERHRVAADRAAFLASWQ